MRMSPNADVPKCGPPPLPQMRISPNTDLPKCGCSHIRTSPNADVPIYGLLACGPIFYEIRTSKSPNTDFPKCGLPQMWTSPNTDLFDIRADVFFTSVRTYTRSVYGKTTSPHLVKRTCVFIVSENIVVKLKKKKNNPPTGCLSGQFGQCSDQYGQVGPILP